MTTIRRWLEITKLEVKTYPLYDKINAELNGCWFKKGSASKKEKIIGKGNTKTESIRDLFRQTRGYMVGKNSSKKAMFNMPYNISEGEEE